MPLAGYNLRAREYYPKLGRFMQNDPIRDRGGSLNWYAYVKNNPINNKDINGLECCQDNVGDLINRIAFVRSILRGIFNGTITCDNYSSQGQDAANTWCFFGFFPYTDYYYKKNDCILECLKVHEGVHRKECRETGEISFGSEYNAWLAELVCLINNCNRLKK